MEKSVFTIAVGKQCYIDMAIALARSFFLWNDGSQIEFYLATDRKKEDLPSDLQKIKVILITQDNYGKGFSPKLYLDRIAPSKCSLFIDADSLVVGSLKNAFFSFKGHSIATIGKNINDGEWFGDIERICEKLNIESIPRFNGGVYYLENDQQCKNVYQTARSLLPDYDTLGFVRLRGYPNDEVLIAAAMAIQGEQPIPEAGDIMNSLLAGPGGVKVDVFRGRSLLKNPKSHIKYNSWYELEEHRPKIIHFLGTPLNSFPYNREVDRLKLVCEKNWPLIIARIWTNIKFDLSYQSVSYIKNSLRPFYHTLFGVRRIRYDSKQDRF
ncbi:MAG: hypothetical protein V3U75_09755 [Methylococcaceae bacterium]